MSKGVLNVMDHTGHTAVAFDSATKGGVSEAMQKFEELVKGKGYTAAKKVGDGKFEVVREFDGNASEILLKPRLIGG